MGQVVNEIFAFATHRDSWVLHFAFFSRLCYQSEPHQKFSNSYPMPFPYCINKRNSQPEAKSYRL